MPIKKHRFASISPGETSGGAGYLYLLLDEWSRKAVQWRVAWHQAAEESRRLLEGWLVDQKILDLLEDGRPEVINDCGRQMKAKVSRRLCEDHGMP